MAVNTKAKRASATAYILPIYVPGVVPDGTIAQSDRQATAWSYSGILAGIIVAGLEYTLLDNRLHFTVDNNLLNYTSHDNRLHYNTREED